MDFKLFDADNHYYEAEDAFTRYGDERVKRYVRWVSEGKRRHIMFGDRVSTGVPNPTFNPIARPGAFHERLMELQEGKGDRNLSGFDTRRYGELGPLPEEYRHRDARLAVMDEQGVEKNFLFPTLGDCVEHYMADDPVMAYDVFHAFNQWLDEDWSYNYQDRLYAPPLHPDARPRARSQGARLRAREGREGRVDPTRSRRRPLPGRSGMGPVLVAHERVQDTRRVPRLRWAHRVRRHVPGDVGPHAGHRPQVPGDALGGADRRPRHPRHHDGPRPRQPVRPLPERPGRAASRWVASGCRTRWRRSTTPAGCSTVASRPSA